MFTKASVMQKYYIKATQHQNEFLNEIWHFESQCSSELESNVIEINFPSMDTEWTDGHSGRMFGKFKVMKQASILFSVVLCL